MNKHTQGNWYVNGSDDVWIGDRICIYVGDENDARLIAAAPDLLEALQELLGYDLPIKKAYVDAAKAAIAKAKGEKHD